MVEMRENVGESKFGRRLEPRRSDGNLHPFTTRHFIPRSPFLTASFLVSSFLESNQEFTSASCIVRRPSIFSLRSLASTLSASAHVFLMAVRMQKLLEIRTATSESSINLLISMDELFSLE
jgi:hypothetical protein